MAEAVVRLRVDASGATRALNGVQSQTNRLQSAFGGLRTALGGIGLTVLARNAIRTSTNFEKLNVRLGLLTKASGTFARSQQIAADAQKAFGLSATEALEGITDITARLAPLNVGVEDIKSTFFGFNTAAKLAGASTIEASNAFRQLAQALGSGRLAGDEFRSISEQIPTLLAPIADELDVNVGQLKKFAAEGKLTSEVVLRALRKIESDGGASLRALLENDPTQVFKNLSNETENLSRAFGDLLQPAVLPIIKGLTELTVAVTNFINSPIGQTAAIFTAIAVAAKGVSVLLPVVAAGLQKVAFAGGVATIALNALPLVAVASALGFVTTAIIKHNKEQKEFNKLVEEGGKKELEAAIKALKAQKARLAAQKRGTGFKEERLDILNEEIAKLEEALETVIKTNKALKDQEDQTKKNEEATKKLKEAMTAVGEEIETSIKGNLRDAITGAQSFGQAMTNVLNKIRDKIIDAQIDKLLGQFGERFGSAASGGQRKGIGGFLGGLLGGLFRENGGPVKANQPYIVGERQPELFVPRTSGTILPSVPTGGGGTTNNMITVNVDATGSSVQGNGSEADQLGGLIASVVQATIIDEQRAGGLLNR